jgi:hypothetical protein
MDAVPSARISSWNTQLWMAVPSPKTSWLTAARVYVPWNFILLHPVGAADAVATVKIATTANSKTNLLNIDSP